jgi:phytoene synthase
MDAGVIESISPLAADVRSESPDCYLATLFAPADKRRALMALYAFDNELARIQRIVHEPIAGLVRLQWWNDVVEGLERGVSVAHPVITELQYAIRENGLDAGNLRRAIDGRRRPFEEEQPSSLASFKCYLVDIGGSVTSAAANFLGVRDETALAVASRVGAARAALEQVNLMAQAASDRPHWLPSAWLDQQGGEPFDVAKGSVIRPLVEFGLAELARGRAEGAPIGRRQLSAFFPATLAGMRLESRLHAGRNDTISNGAFTLFLSWLRGRF